MSFEQKLLLPLFWIYRDIYQCILILPFKIASKWQIVTSVSNIYIYFFKYKIKHSSPCKRVFVLYTIKKNTDISTHYRCVLSGLFFNPTWPTFHDNFHVLPNDTEHCIAGDVLGNDILFCPCSAGKLVEILTGSDFRV